MCGACNPVCALLCCCVCIELYCRDMDGCEGPTFCPVDRYRCAPNEGDALRDCTEAKEAPCAAPLTAWPGGSIPLGAIGRDCMEGNRWEVSLAAKCCGWDGGREWPEDRWGGGRCKEGVRAWEEDGADEKGGRGGVVEWAGLDLDKNDNGVGEAGVVGGAPLTPPPLRPPPFPAVDLCWCEAGEGDWWKLEGRDSL